MTLEDKIDLLEAGLLKTLGMLRHVKEVGYQSKNLQEWLQEEIATINDETDWDEIEVEPVAWMVCKADGSPHSVYLDREEASIYSESSVTKIVPLYRLDEEVEDDDE